MRYAYSGCWQEVLMKTIELIAEILVIGIGAALWMVLLWVSMYPELEETLTTLSLITVLPSMAIVYVLGIMTDKFAELVFNRFLSDKYGGMSAEEGTDWKNRRDQVLSNNEYAQTLHLSNQSRMKILRGWTINFFGLAFSSAMYLFRDCEACGFKTNANISFLLLLFAGICIYLWRYMERSQKGTIDRLLLTEE